MLGSSAKLSKARARRGWNRRRQRVSMIPWQTCKKDFEWDGSWRDIYVLQTTLGDWQVLSNMLSKNYKISFQVNGSAQSFPASVDEVFAIQKRASPLLTLSVENIHVACHFFTPDEIEFDIDPREITSQSDLDALLGFLRFVGDTVNKPSLLTSENGREYPIITYNPISTQFSHHPVQA